MGAGAESVLQVVLRLRNQLAAETSGIRGQLQGIALSAAGVGAAISAGVTAPMLAAGKAALEASGSFETSLNVLQASSGATASQMAAVSERAMQLGADITLPATSALDASQAMLELSKAGLSVNDTLSAARGVLEMSAAGEISNAEAAQIAAGALNTFGLAGSEASTIAAMLAAGANASSASMTDLAQGMQQGGFAFKAAGLTASDLVTSLAALTNVGLTGSDAGTALKNALMQLAAPTSTAAGLMQELSIDVFDATGTMLPMPALITELNRGLAGMTNEQRLAALKTIALADGAKALIPLLDLGATGFEQLQVKINDQNAATEMAAARMKGWQGAIGAAQSAWETFQLSLGNVLKDILQPLVVKLTEVINWLGALNPEILKIGVAFGGIVAVAGAVALGIGAISGALSLLAAPLAALLGPIALVVGAIATLGIGVVALKTHLETARSAAYNQAAQIALTSDSYDTYVDMMQTAGLKTKTMTEDVYDLIQAHKDQADAAKLAGYTEQIDTWKAALASYATQLEQNKLLAQDWKSAEADVTEGTRRLITETERQITAFAAANDGFTDLAVAAGLLTEADRTRITALKEAIVVEEAEAAQLKYIADLTTQVGAAVVEGAGAQISAAGALANAWKDAMAGINAATGQGMDENKKVILDQMAQAQKEYAEHAVAIAKLEVEKHKAITKLQIEAQDITERLTKAHDQAGLAQLGATSKAKFDATIAYYDAKIKTEKVGQQSVFDVAKVYYQATIRALVTTLSAQLEAQKANIKALVSAVAGGYASMTAAVAAYNKVREGQDALAATAAAIAEVQGAFNGIQAAGRAAADAAAAEFAAWEASSTSLSDSLKQVGIDFDGLRASAGAAGSAASSAVTKVLDPVEEAAKTVDRLAGMIKSARDAFSQLATYAGPQAGWERGFEALLTGVKRLVTRVGEVVNELKAGGLFDIENSATGAGPLARITSFLQAVVAIDEAISKTLPVVDALSALKLPLAIDAQLTALGQAISLIVYHLQYLAQEVVKAEAVWSAKAFSDPLALIFANVKAIVDGANALAAFVATDLDAVSLTAAIAAIKVLVQQLVGGLAAVAQELPNLGEQAATLAQNAKTVLAIVEPALTAFKALLLQTFSYGTDWLGNDTQTRMLEKISDLARFLGDLAAAFGMVGESVGTELLTAAKALGDAAGPVLAVVTPALNAFRALLLQTFSYGMDWLGNDTQTRMLEKISDLARFLGDLAAAFGEAGRSVGTELLAAAKLLAESVGPVFNVIKPAIDALTQLTDFSPLEQVDPLEAAQRAGVLALLAKEVAKKFAAAAEGVGGELLTAAKGLAEAAGPVLGVIKGAIDALKELTAFNALEQVDPIEAAQRAGVLAMLAREVALKFAAAAEGVKTDLLTAAKGLAESAAPVLGVIKGAIDALAELTKFNALEQVDPIEAAQRAGVLALLAKEVALKFAAAADGVKTDLLTAAKALAEGASPVLGVIKGAIDALAELTKFNALEQIDPIEAAQRAGVLALLAKEVAKKFAAAAEGVGGDLLAAAKGLADGASSVFNVIKSAIDALAELTAFNALEQINPIEAAQRAGVLALLAREVALKFAAAAEGVETDLLTAAKTFSEAVGPVLNLIKAGIDALADLTSFAPDKLSPTETDRRLGVLKGFIEMVAQKFIDAAGDIDSELVAAAKTFAEGVAPVVSVVSSSVAALTDLAELAKYRLSAGSMASWMTNIVTFIATMVQQLAAAAPKAAADLPIARQFAEDIAGTVQLVSDATGQIQALAGSKRIPAGWAYRIVEDLAVFIRQVRKAAAEFGGDIMTEVQAFAGAAQTVGAAMAAGLAAIQGTGSSNTAATLAGAMAILVAAVKTAVAAILAEFTALQEGAYDAGLGWAAQLAAGIAAGLPLIEAAVQSVANLFPHSPAKEGPLRQAPNWSAFLLGGLLPVAGQVASVLAGSTSAGPYAPAYAGAPSVTPVVGRGGGGGTVLQFVYAPTISLADQREAEEVIAPVIRRVIKREGRRE